MTLDDQPAMTPEPGSYFKPPSPTREPISMRRLLTMGVGVRLFVDTGIQIFGPYLFAISAGLGISIVSLGVLNSLRSLMGLAAPVIGSIADGIGYRSTMRALLVMAAAGMFVFALSWNLWVTAVAMILMGVGLFSFSPVLQAYISGQIPYARRARGLGIVEYGWALASIIGLSVSGLLIDRFGWRAPFWALGVALLAAAFVFGALPGRPAGQSNASAAAAFTHWRKWAARLLELVMLETNARSAWSAIAVNGLNVFATATISIVYGVWLTREYGLTTTRLGLVVLALGLSELAGSVLVSLLGDRLGKYRSILASSTCSVAGYVLLPFLNFRVLSIVAGLVVLRFLFEVGIVSNIALLSEQVPTQRGKVLALASATVTTSVAVASVVGPVAYLTWGIFGPALISATAALLAATLAFRWVRES